IDSPEEGEEYLVGDEVLVNYTITNLGEIEDTQMIVLSVYDEQEDLVYEDYEEVTLGDPEKKGSDGVYEGEFTWVIYEGRIGNFDLVVKSEDAEKEVGIKVKEISEYELTVKTLGEGTTDPDPGTYNHTEGENVTIEAIPEEDWVFKEWRGDVAEGKQEEKEINMTIDSNRSLTAVFNRTSFFEIEKVQFEGGKELVEGEDLIIEYTIANAGDIEGTSLVNLTVYNDSDSVVFEDTERVTLEGDNEYVGTFNWETEEGDAGEYYMVLSSKDDEREVSEEIKINTGSQENSDSTGESSYTWLYILISLLLLSLILIPLFFLREREEEDKIPEQSQTWDENKPVTGTDYEEDTPKQRIQETGSPNTGKKWSQGAEDQRAQSVPRKKVMKKKKKVKKVKKKDPSAQEDLDEEGEKEEEKKLEEKLDEELEQLEKEVDEEEESPETEEEIEDVGYTECPLCGNEVQVDAEKCFACGKDLTED
ncbi:MAG: hypothetical protein KGY76_07585, partial [Candidatus Thermoplasmatota archaeon]|nr:hypothetical protein [Candidatus Thermoplasmatota archaeon]